MDLLIKRNGYLEKFDERKIYASVFAACMTLRVTDEEAELIANMVTDEIKKSIKEHKEISAQTLHNHIVKSLKKYHPDAAFMYDTHKDLS